MYINMYIYIYIYINLKIGHLLPMFMERHNSSTTFIKYSNQSCQSAIVPLRVVKEK